MALTDKTIDKRGRSEQAEFQMKLAILQNINPRIARRPGPPRKKRPRKNVTKESPGSEMLPPEPKDNPGILGKEGCQRQVIAKDISTVTAGRLEDPEDLAASEVSAC